MTFALSVAYVWAWARAFAFTEIVEAPIYRRMLGVSLRRGLTASAITHPFVWFVFPPIASALGIGYVPYAISAELFAWLVEAVYFACVSRTPMRRALIASFVANASSVVLALGSRALFGAP
jgi:hypothetical protein